MSDRRIALVPPRYGPDVIGGAEASFREVAAGLASRGWEVDVYTTCAIDHFTWANHYPAGDSHDGDVRVRRYPVVNDTSGADRALVDAMVARGEMPTLPEQERWMNDGLRSPELFHALIDESDRYRAVVVTPYLFWTSFAAAAVAPERTIVRPCLHDEPQARFELFSPMLEGSARLWLNTEPERDLLDSLFPGHAPGDVVGEGVTIPKEADPAGFRARHGLGERRFVLYAGRREGAKGWERLLDTFSATVRKGNLDLALVTIGVGDVHIPADVADSVFDLGRVDDRERDDAFAAASGYLQPSALESFSRTIMEAWLTGTLVIANAASEVVAWHCERSGAGLLYDDDNELEQCLRFLAEAPEAAATLAAPGRDYVLDNYTWEATLDRMEASLEQMP
ncbi:MAG: glycosyltransferase family 4 protein [Acidimicrobiales bacterium]|nr:glycosyltransferase family 4 protein [Acidimicrobiales bacterium]